MKSLVNTLAALSLLAVIPASAQTLIDSFEGSTIFSGQNGASTSFSTVTGVTDGSNSWALTNLGAGENEYFQSFDSSLKTSLLGATGIEISFFAETVSGTFAGLRMDINGTGGFQQIPAIFPGSVNNQFNIFIPIDSAGQTIIANSQGAGDFLGIQFYLNSDFAASDTLYVDNVIAVPEPQTFALLAGFASLALVALRRRRA